MIDPSKYGDKIQYYEAIRSLFVKVGKYFGVEYNGLTIDEALQENVFDKFEDGDITSQDVEVVSLLYLADLIHQLSINLPEGDHETKARLTAFDLELKSLQESVTAIAGKETKVEVKTLDLTALDGIKAKMLQLQTGLGDLKTVEIKQLNNSIKMNEIMTELDSIKEDIAELVVELKKKSTGTVISKGGVGFGSSVINVLSKTLEYYSDGKLQKVSDANGTQTMQYTGTQLTKIVGSGSKKTREFVWSGNKLIKINVL